MHTTQSANSDYGSIRGSVTKLVLYPAKCGDDSSSNPSTLVSASISGDLATTALATGKIELGSGTLKTRAFFDPGSQRSFVSRDVVDELKLQPVGIVNLVLSGINKTATRRPYEIVALDVKMGTVTSIVHALILERVPVIIRAPGLAVAASSLTSRGILLADPQVRDVVDGVEVLIGADSYFDFVTGHEIIDNINLLQTPSGFMIAGPLIQPINQGPIKVHNNEFISYAVSCKLGAFHDPLDLGQVDDLTGSTRLWDLENLGIVDSEVSVDDHDATDRFTKSVHYDGQQYWVNLPFKEDRPCLPDNKGPAYQQLKGLLLRLQKEPALLTHYNQVIQQLKDLNFTEEVGPAPQGKETHHLPHHGVKKDSISTPLRVVFNASSKGKGREDSLNDCLLKGPNLTQKLLNSLLKFRGGRFGYTADISKAFLRVGLKEEDRDYTRFLWKEDPHDMNSRTITYRFKAVLFGATCSPFLLQATLDHHFRQVNTPMSELLARSFYVDNLLGSVNIESELLQIYPEANSILATANMPLQQWVTNSRVLRNKVNKEEEEKMLDEVKVLGMNWDSIADTLNLVTPTWGSLPTTKRSLLSEISTVYDPLGLVAPLLIKAKILMQETWKLQTEWDHKIPLELTNRWSEIRNELSKVHQFKLPRAVYIEHASLHVFCDASSRAYGAACYLVHNDQSHLLTSKCKVAPIKSRTLPQLELMAMLIGGRLIKWVMDTLNAKFTSVHLWTDNEACLQWVKNNKSEIVFVKNRVAEINRLKDQYRFQTLHVSSEENPADLLSRGLTFNQLAASYLWWEGPKWLKDRSGWPQQKEHVAAPITVTTVTSVAEPTRQGLDRIINDERYTDWVKLIKVTGHVLKFLKVKFMPNLELTPETYWLRHVQSVHFSDTHDILSGKLTKPRMNLSRKRIDDLNLYLDNHGIIRSRGRIDHADIRSYGQDPILVSGQAYVIRLYIQHVHEHNHHSGVNQTLAMLRQQLWIPQARPVIKHVLANCYICKRLTGHLLLQPGPPVLPKERVTFTRPFKDVGVDYSGAILIKDGDTKKLRKVYICLFTCMASRAVHLEIAKDNSAVTFVDLFRRFVSSWGLPTKVVSDNAGNFHGTADFLLTLANQPEVSKYFQERSLRWHFIHARSPWEGGFYERLIGVVKKCLSLAMYRRVFDYDSIVTLLKEVMTRVNNRPLTYISSSLEDIEPLTPNHLLYGRTIDPLPPLTSEEEGDPAYENRSQLIKAYEMQSMNVSKFTKIWAEQYLSALRTRHVTIAKTQDPPVSINDIVLVETPEHREFWPLARIIDLIPDSEGVVRSAKVMLNGHVQTRTLNKLVALETQSDAAEEQRQRYQESTHTKLSSNRSDPNLTLAERKETREINEKEERTNETSRCEGKTRRKRKTRAAAARAAVSIREQLA